MLETLIEGAGEVVLPCSIGLLLPGLLSVIVGWKRSVWAVATYVVVAATVVWLRVSSVFAIEATWMLTVVLMVAAALAWSAARRQSADTSAPPVPWLIIGAAATLGTFAGSTWQPCVGEQLGEILNNASSSPPAWLFPMAVYVIGVTLVLWIVAMVPLLTGKGVANHRTSLIVGGVLIACLAVAVGVGRYDEILSRLAQLSVR